MAIEIREGTQPSSYMDQPEREKALNIATGGAGVETLAGVGAVILAILGLAHVLPLLLAAIATIVAGAALLFGGGAVAGGVQYFHMHSASESKFAESGGGLTAEFIGGAAGVVLGILALIDVVPAVLLPAAAIAFGGALLIGTGATSRLSYSPAITGGVEQTRAETAARKAAASTAGAEVLIGMASIALGILALVGFAWITLTLVALLCMGVSLFFNGAWLTSRMQAAVHHHVHHW